ncbi:MAG: hypothetical protein KF906_09070 [Actinobacteria bacterium]|nr:hypothetical protein [Actinomycetota bacterium]
MSNIFGSDDGIDAIVNDATASEVAEAVVDAGADVFDDAGAVADGGGTMWDLLAESGVDTVWLDLDGDMIPETVIATGGPFAVDDVDGGYDVSDDWSTAETYEFDAGDLDLVGEPISVLLPFDLSDGYADPFAMSDTDWSTCDAYDPMTVPADWTTEGYADFNDPYQVPGMDAPFSHAGDFYDLPVETSGYWDTAAYYDTSGDYLDSSASFDSWDLPMSTHGTGMDTGFDPGMGMDTGFDPGMGMDTGFDSGMGYDPTSSWDPTAGDAAHDAFISTITEDYSDPMSSWDSSSAMDASQQWMDVYHSADDLSWDAWNASVDAYLADDGQAAYDYNQLSIEAGSMADDAWNYSNDAWSDTSSYTDTSYMDTSSYTDTSYTDTSYDSSWE